MPVKGVTEAVAKLNRIPAAVERQVKEIIEQTGTVVLEDMQMMTPVDPSHAGAHARDGLVSILSEDGLQVNVGLPTARLASDYFWFRFLDGGTKGGQVKYWRRMADGKRVRATMNVPARAALHIRARALDGNINEIRKLIVEAIQAGLKTA